MDSMGTLLPVELAARAGDTASKWPVAASVTGAPAADQNESKPWSALALLPWVAAPIAVLLDARGTYLLATLAVSVCAAGLAWRGNPRPLRALLAVGALGIGLVWLGGLEYG